MHRGDTDIYTINVSRNEHLFVQSSFDQFNNCNKSDYYKSFLLIIFTSFIKLKALNVIYKEDITPKNSSTKQEKVNGGIKREWFSSFDFFICIYLFFLQMSFC
jgi:hypothetical protein